ncbi:unnamed protein product [Rotaria magnacalcarata]|uniref:Uncharacterized protein n=1 Tax=Rotaria magnacalcarata TaxID=392030 RepID=A0A816E9M6_9BILA|nr:unnamed protein product [Rotaria magnacalcarata]
MSSAVEMKPEKEKTSLNIIKKWFLNSPTHGIRRISIATSIFERVFWSLTFVVFTTLMCIFIYTVIVKYIAQPTKINLSVRQHRDTKNFPAITFCNLNPLRSEKFIDDDLHEQRTPPNSNQFYTDDDYKNRFIQYMGRLVAKNLENKQSTTIPSGYKLDDLLVQCTFNGRTCHRNLTSFFHPNYGNSIQRNDTYDFWSIDDENTVESYKLFLELYLHQNEYIQYLDDRAAFRIFIHRKDDIPILSQNSFFLAPTTFTKLIFSQRIISFSQHCRNDLTPGMKQIFSSHDVRYSQALCFKLCELRYIRKVCQCTDQSLMVYFQFFSQNNTKTPTSSIPCSTNEECLENRATFNSRQHCPDCLPECEIIQYKVQSSFAAYPNTRSIEKVLQRVDKHFKAMGQSLVQSNTSACSNNRKVALLDNIVAVEISASPVATEILAESPMYTWVDVISSIGGQTGLWIGVSLISFVEIAELLFLLLCHCMEKIYQSISIRWKHFCQRYISEKISSRF